MQEYSRITALHVRKRHPDACQKAGCSNNNLSIRLAPSAYRSFGFTARGAPRHQCRGCGSTFSSGSATRRHKRTDQTGSILLNLVNKVPLSRICEINGVTFPQIYSKVDFIYRQCLAMASNREGDLARCLSGKDQFFATDAQTILLNWPVRGRRGTVPLLQMSTVHAASQFVVASTVDYDPDVAVEDVDEAMFRCGDFLLPRAMRRHARLWSEREYMDAMLRSLPGFFNAEDPMTGGKMKLPGKGSRVRNDAFMYAHVMLVRKLTGQGLRQANYSVDADSGLAAAFCAINVDMVREGRANVTEVRFEKGLTNDERSTLARMGTDAFYDLARLHAGGIEEFQDIDPDLTRRQALVAYQMKERFKDIPLEDRSRILASEGWDWPFHTKSEPRKSLRLKTDTGYMDWAGLSRVICGGSVHAVDAWFNFARRRVAGFERGLPTASNQHRIWHAYGFYDPEMVPKMIGILRFYHNWMLRGRDGQTPAMRVGLAKGLIYPRDLFSA